MTQEQFERLLEDLDVIASDLNELAAMAEMFQDSFDSDGIFFIKGRVKTVL